MGRLSRAQLAGELVLAVEVRLDGRAWRRATRPVQAGDEVIAGGLLLDEVPCESSPEATVAEERTLGLQVDGADDWLALITVQALSFARLEADVILLPEGVAWEDGELLLRGVVSTVSLAPGAPLDLQLVEELTEDAALLPTATQIVGTATWHQPTSGETDACAEEAVAAGYPVVFGAPGLAEAGDALEAVPAWPALVVNARWPFVSNAAGAVAVLVCGHRSSFSAVRVLSPDRYDASGAQLWYADGAPLEEALDLAGQAVTLAEIQASGTVADPDYLPWEGGQPLYCQALAGGGTGVEGAGAVASAASVVAWLLERSTLRCAPVGDPALLRGLRFDFWANDSRAPALIAIEDVLAYCSASLVPGPDGLELVTWDPCPLLADAEAVIGPAWGCVADGPMLVEGLDRVVTALEVRYAPRADTGEYTRTLTIGPAAAVPSPGARALVDPVAETAWARWGLRWAEALELPTVWSTATAAEVGRLALRRMALPTATLTYLVPQDLQVLRPGAVVRVEDPERGLAGQLAWVRSLPRGPGPRRALLQLLPRPEVL